jgi:hypothetical protein
MGSGRPPGTLSKDVGVQLKNALHADHYSANAQMAAVPLIIQACRSTVASFAIFINQNVVESAIKKSG